MIAAKFSARCVIGALLAQAPMLWAQSSPAPPSAQHIYNEAQAAFDNGDWRGAINGLVLIAKPDQGAGLSHSQGIIHSRLAQAYAHAHQIEKAFGEADLALKGLAPDDDAERALLWLAIGDAQRLDLAITQAAATYEKALASAQAAHNAELISRVQLGLALGYMTVDPARSSQLLDAVLAAPLTAAATKLDQAQIYDVRGRASLNLGQIPDAKPFLAKALELSGGLSGLNVSLIQIGIRGDAALGALLMHEPEGARKYLSWTGAGHLPSEEWTGGLGDPPVCSEAQGIGPNDMAVIEFSIAADGHVMGAVPVYASRPGTLGLTFARAVKEWHWNPERIAKLPSFWRNMVRIEMRCIAHPNPHGLSDPYRRETIEWLNHSQLSAEDLAPVQGYVAPDDPRLEREDLAAVPALFARLRYETDYVRCAALSRHLSAALNQAQAPAAPRALAMSLQPIDVRHSSWAEANVRMKAEHVAAMERSDPRSAATAWLTLEYAIALESKGRFEEARPVLDRILAYPSDVLAEHDPVREVTILHMSALQRRAGDRAGAETRVIAAGLNRAQCMLFDVRPVATDTSVSSSEFPNEALRWGFDGYVREAFDIDAAGHVQNARTIIAYPPFVFRSAAESTVAHFRYLAPVVEGGAAGCVDHALNMRYQVDIH